MLDFESVFEAITPTMVSQQLPGGNWNFIIVLSVTQPRCQCNVPMCESRCICNVTGAQGSHPCAIFEVQSVNPLTHVQMQL